MTIPWGDDGGRARPGPPPPAHHAARCTHQLQSKIMKHNYPRCSFSIAQASPRTHACVFVCVGVVCRCGVWLVWVWVVWVGGWRCWC